MEKILATVYGMSHTGITEWMINQEQKEFYYIKAKVEAELINPNIYNIDFDELYKFVAKSNLNISNRIYLVNLIDDKNIKEDE